jgi:hypothetical protein
MGARLTVRVTIPPETPVEGAEVLASNLDAWSSSRREWKGRTDSSGNCTWKNIDTGTLGDRYDIQVEYTDPEGLHWSGSASERVNSPRDVSVVLAPSYSGSLKIPSEVVTNLSDTSRGTRILAGLNELDSTLKAGWSLAAIGLAYLLVEEIVRLRLSEQGSYREEWDSLALGVILSLAAVAEQIDSQRLANLRRIADTRNRAAHGTGSQSVPALAIADAKVITELLIEWFGGVRRSIDTRPKHRNEVE